MMPGRTNRDLLILTALTLISIFFYGQIDYLSEPFSGMDLKYYREMAAASPSIAAHVLRPFAYRILGPWLAGLAGNDLAGFRILTATFSVLLILAFYRLLILTGISRRSAMISSALFIMSKHLFGINTWNFFQLKDLISLACLTAAMFFLYRKKPVPFSAVMFAGALAGELALVLVPVTIVFLAEKGELAGSWKRWAAACLPALLAFSTIRILVPAAGGMNLIEAGLHYGRKLRYPMAWYGLLVNPFIPSVLLPVIFFRHTASLLGKNLHLAVFFSVILVSALFGSNNERLMAPAFIPFFIIVGSIIDREFARSTPLVVFLLLAGLFSSMHHMIARYPLPARSYTVLFSGGSAVAVTVVFFLYSIRGKWRTGTGRSVT